MMEAVSTSETSVNLYQTTRRNRLIALMMGTEAHLKRRSVSTRLHGATSEKTVVFMLAAVRTFSVEKK
jgi:hypothetical protein